MELISIGITTLLTYQITQDIFDDNISKSLTQQKKEKKYKT
jgi:hypothetical protein